MSSSSSFDEDDELRFADIDLDRYSDAPWDHPTDVAVSTLTRIGVLQGNDDGTFAADRGLNRAEFVQIIMRLLNDNRTVATNCFSDVSPSAWYADVVCRAKAAGLVRGNAQAGVDPSLWRFEPNREIQYEEAVKILVNLYALPVNGDTEGMDWYVPFINAAAREDLDLAGLTPGERITRGEMARLTVAFVAWTEGRLEELREVESMSSASSRSSSSRSSSSSSRSSVSSSSMTSSSRSSSSASNTAIRSQILLLGEMTPVIAGVSFFSNSEPIDVDGFDITLTSPSDSVTSLIVYDENGAQIGTATAVAGSSTRYHSTIPFGKLLLPYREERNLYIRARLQSRETGGQSGEEIQIDTIEITGEGRWSSEAYGTTSTDTFPVYQTAFSRITSIINSGTAEGTVTSGQERLLADFTFTADNTESLYDARLMTLTFTVEQAGGVTVSNPVLRTDDGSNISISCTVVSSTIVCSNIDPSIGTIDSTRRIRLYGDVTVPGSATNPSLRIVLNNPGSPSSPGDIMWTDGVTTFDWVDLDQPIVRGTLFD